MRKRGIIRAREKEQHGKTAPFSRWLSSIFAQESPHCNCFPCPFFFTSAFSTLDIYIIARGRYDSKRAQKTTARKGNPAKRWQKPRRKNAIGAHTYAFERSIALQADCIPNCDTQRSTFPSEKIKNRASGWNTRGENSHRRPFEL
ncbi:MAG TPA: hypothetical protein IAA59_01775 [Candidatus Faecaligallichristensenella faecipullorum]|nr:hypothetical protein [Candidatus Faecaligallichristensenella faecipullorum]